MKRVVWIRIVSYLGAAVLALGGLSLCALRQARSRARQLEYVYNRSLEDLSADLDCIDLYLTKSRYVGTPAQQSAAAAELFRASGSAKSALSQLPTEGKELAGINRFLSQVGAYSLVLSNNAINGRATTDAELESLRGLHETAALLSAGLRDLRIDDWTLPDTPQPQAPDGFAASLDTLEDSLLDTPSLVYDGPFSDHIQTKTSQLLADAPEVSADAARAVAARLTGLPGSLLRPEAGEAGKTPAYGFQVGDTVVRVTKNGGYPLFYRKAVAPAAAVFTPAQAVERAAAYLAGCFEGRFVDRYYAVDEGVCVVNFAHQEDGTICYPDLVKVGVALDSGEIVLFEARGFLMNHQAREIPAPRCSEQEARAILSPRLRVRSVSRALIPSGGGAELPCYEFLCAGQDGEELLVYVNTQTCREEQLLLLLKTDGGTLTK